MLYPLFFVCALAAVESVCALPHRLRRSAPATAPSSAGFDVPITRRTPPTLRKRNASGSTTLGNNNDLLYSVPVRLGETILTVHLDTGSSDLWVVSDLCTTSVCANSTSARYPSKQIKPTGATVDLRYGDSSTATFAKGDVAHDVASIAGIAIQDQTFGAISSTTNPTVLYGVSGIFGLGFPAGSSIQNAVINAQFDTPSTTDYLLQSTTHTGPLLSRVVTSDQLLEPMFAVSLQRGTIDPSDGQGVLSIGKLPDGVKNSSLTWVPVRLYSADEGGLRAPTFAPKEVFPLRWEVDLEAVFLDGVELPATTFPGASKGRVTALLDTGNSLIRGPQDLIDNVLKTVSPAYATGNNVKTPAIMPCAPRTLSFQIGGKSFPIDPRDFIGQAVPNQVTCVADNLVATDAPSTGALFQWSLGDPFFKSNLVAFHYGNLTHPSVDPPRIGFMSMVPDNANNLLAAAVDNAAANNGNFAFRNDAAPTALAAARVDATIVQPSGAHPTSTGNKFWGTNSRGGDGSSSSSSRAFTASSLRLLLVVAVIPLALGL